MKIFFSVVVFTALVLAASTLNAKRNTRAKKIKQANNNLFIAKRI